MDSVKDQKGPRDPGRIPEVLSWLAIYWKRHPDMRLGQIVGNMAANYDRDDPYYLEDDDLLESMKREVLNM